MKSELILHVETQRKYVCDTITRDDASKDQNKGICLKKSLEIMKNRKAFDIKRGKFHYVHIALRVIVCKF